MFKGSMHLLVVLLLEMHIGKCITKVSMRNNLHINAYINLHFQDGAFLYLNVSKVYCFARK